MPRSRLLPIDGRQWLSRSQAAEYCAVTIHALRESERSGELRPTRVIAGVRVYSVHALDDWRRARGRQSEVLREASAILERGGSPLDLVTRVGLSPERARQVLSEYAWLTGAWLVSGPARSRAAWCAAYGVPDDVTPDLLRRGLELLATSHLRQAWLTGCAYAPSTVAILCSHRDRARARRVATALGAAGQRVALLPVRAARGLAELREREHAITLAQHLVILASPALAHAWLLLGVALERARWSGQRCYALGSECPAIEHDRLTRCASLDDLHDAIVGCGHG